MQEPQQPKGRGVQNGEATEKGTLDQPRKQNPCIVVTPFRSSAIRGPIVATHVYAIWHRGQRGVGYKNGQPVGNVAGTTYEEEGRAQSPPGLKALLT